GPRRIRASHPQGLGRANPTLANSNPYASLGWGKCRLTRRCSGLASLAAELQSFGGAIQPERGLRRASRTTTSFAPRALLRSNCKLAPSGGSSRTPHTGPDVRSSL